LRNRCVVFFVFSILLLRVGASAVSREDWNSPELDRATLTALKPVVGAHDDFSTFTSDLVRVQWRADDPLYLYVMVPKLVRNPPVILYLYDYDSETDRFLGEKFATLLTARGVAAVGFSAALSGHRYHGRPMKAWFVSELQESLGSTAHDVQMIIDYLATRHDVDTSRVGIFGVGSGATIAVLAASADARIQVAGLINPWGDWPYWVHQSKVIPKDERSGLETKAFLDSVENLDPVRYLPQLKIPIRLEYVNYGGAIPPVVKQRIEASAPPQVIVVPPDKALADFEETAGQLSLDWIKDKLLAR
jgi:hypothetical protein